MNLRRSAVPGVMFAGLIAAVGALYPSGTALAAASVVPFTFSETETFADSPPECMPVVKSGVTNATVAGSGQITTTANGSAVHFSDTFTYRTDFTDGSFLTGTAHEHASITDSRVVTTSTRVIREPRTIFSADGAPIGEVMIHAISHTTVNKVTGETSANVDRFFFTCH